MSIYTKIYSNFFLIFQTLNALGKSWHPEHFVCQVCQKPITNTTFNEREGQPVCASCFAQKFCEKCYHCKQPIIGVSNKLKKKLFACQRKNCWKFHFESEIVSRCLPMATTTWDIAISNFSELCISVFTKKEEKIWQFSRKLLFSTRWWRDKSVVCGKYFTTLGQDIGNNSIFFFIILESN